MCSISHRRFPTKKSLKRQFFKLRNLCGYSRDPACIQCGMYLHGGKRCSVLPWVCRGCWWRGSGSQGLWRVKMNSHGVSSGELQFLSWACCPVTVGHKCGGKLRGAAQPFSRAASAALPFLANTPGHPSTWQAAPSSALQQVGDGLACCRWWWPGLQLFLGVVTLPDIPQAALVVDSLKQRFGAPDCPLE